MAGPWLSGGCEHWRRVSSGVASRNNRYETCPDRKWWPVQIFVQIIIILTSSGVIDMSAATIPLRHSWRGSKEDVITHSLNPHRPITHY